MNNKDLEDLEETIQLLEIGMERITEEMNVIDKIIKNIKNLSNDKNISSTKKTSCCILS